MHFRELLEPQIRRYLMTDQHLVYTLNSMSSKLLYVCCKGIPVPSLVRAWGRACIGLLDPQKPKRDSSLPCMQ